MTTLEAIQTIEPLKTSMESMSHINFVTGTTGLSYALLADQITYDLYSAQVADPTAYVVVDQDTINQEKFSPFLLQIKFSPTATDDGICLISSKHGTQCMLQNAGDNGVDTYRVNTTKWATAVAAYSSTQADIITNLKANSGALQDPAATNVQTWFDSMYCTGKTSLVYTCTAWQPDWMGGVTQGYPRFGPNESEDGELTYLQVDVSEAFVAATNVKTWVIEGASALGAAAFAISLSLTF